MLGMVGALGRVWEVVQETETQGGGLGVGEMVQGIRSGRCGRGERTGGAGDCLKTEGKTRAAEV